MKNSSNNSSRRIIIFAQQDLQNSILIGFIQQRTNIDCKLTCSSEWKPEWNDFDGQTLVLIDTDSGCLEKVQNVL